MTRVIFGKVGKIGRISNFGAVGDGSNKGNVGRVIGAVPQGHFCLRVLNLAELAICLIFTKNCTREY